jgi:hypothetical protein
LGNVWSSKHPMWSAQLQLSVQSCNKSTQTLRVSIKAALFWYDAPCSRTRAVACGRFRPVPKAYTPGRKSTLRRCRSVAGDIHAAFRLCNNGRAKKQSSTTPCCSQCGLRRATGRNALCMPIKRVQPERGRIVRSCGRVPVSEVRAEARQGLMSRNLQACIHTILQRTGYRCTTTHRPATGTARSGPSC